MCMWVSMGCACGGVKGVHVGEYRVCMWVSVCDCVICHVIIQWTVINPRDQLNPNTNQTHTHSSAAVTLD